MYDKALTVFGACGLFGLIPLAATALRSSDEPPRASASGVQARLFLDQVRYREGEPVVGELRFTNVGNSEARFLAIDGLAFINFQLLLNVSRDGKELRAIEPSLSPTARRTVRLSSAKGSPQRLEAGQRATRYVPINLFFDVSVPGEYVVRGRWGLGNEGFALSPVRFAVVPTPADGKRKMEQDLIRAARKDADFDKAMFALASLGSEACLNEATDLIERARVLSRPGMDAFWRRLATTAGRRQAIKLGFRVAKAESVDSQNRALSLDLVWSRALKDDIKEHAGDLARLLDVDEPSIQINALWCAQILFADPAVERCIYRPKVDPAVLAQTISRLREVEEAKRLSK